MLTDDDVLDFMVMEAVSLKVNHEEAKAAKDTEKAQFRNTKNKDNFKSLEKFR